MNLFSWLRKWTCSAVLSGVDDAIQLLSDQTPPEAPPDLESLRERIGNGQNPLPRQLAATVKKARQS